MNPLLQNNMLMRLLGNEQGASEGVSMPMLEQQPAAGNPLLAPAAPSAPGGVRQDPLPQMDWNALFQQGQSGGVGVNQMPFTFSNYMGVPSDPEASMEMFYPQASPPQQEPQTPQNQPKGLSKKQEQYLNNLMKEERRQMVPYRRTRNT